MHSIVYMPFENRKFWKLLRDSVEVKRE